MVKVGADPARQEDKEEHGAERVSQHWSSA